MRDAALWRWVRDSSGRCPGALYTNDPATVYFTTHRPSRTLLWIIDADTTRALARALARTPGTVIWARGYTERVIFPELLSRVATPSDLERDLPLTRIATCPEGIVWATSCGPSS